MPSFYVKDNIDPYKEEAVSENLKAKEFMCDCCNSLKMDNRLVDALTKLRKEYQYPFYVVKGYHCENWCAVRGKNPNRSHTQGVAVDVHFALKVPVIELMDEMVKRFPYVGLIHDSTGEFYIHLQVANDSLYWICLKKEGEHAKYLYYKDYLELRHILETKPVYKELRI